MEEDDQPEKPLFKMVGNVFPDVWDQGSTPWCVAHATTQCLTMVYRIWNPHKHGRRVFSPQYLINERCKKIASLEPHLKKPNGLYSIKKQPNLRLRQRVPAQVDSKRYTVESFKTVYGEEAIVKELLFNFGSRGPQYPLLGSCCMGKLKSKRAFRATRERPYTRKKDLTTEQLKRRHAVLIIGIYVSADG